MPTLSPPPFTLLTHPPSLPIPIPRSGPLLLSGLVRSPPFLTLVASLLSVVAAFAIPYSRYLFSASFSWASFCLATFLPIDRFLIRSDTQLKYRRIDVVICSTCMVLSIVCASLLGERGNGLSSVLIPFLVHILRFQYMSPPSLPTQHEKNLSQLIAANIDMTTLVFITFTSFLALAPSYPGASQLVFGMCSSIFAATYLSISDISIPLTRSVLREISAYTCLGLLLMSLLLDGWAGWLELGSSDGLAYMMVLWSFLSAVKNIIIMILIQNLSPINASFVDLIGNLSTTLYSPAVWKISAMCISYMAIASTLLPHHIGEKRVRFLKIRVSKFITLVIALFLAGFGLFMTIKPRSSGYSQRVTASSASAYSSAATSSFGKDAWNTTIHPISYLMESHLTRFEDLVNRQTNTYPEAVKEYKRRHNLNPPPNFDKWYAYATEHKAVVFDEFDSISDSLKPFWGLEPSKIRENVRDALSNPESHLLGVHIRGGQIANLTGFTNGQWFEAAIETMIGEFVQYLPDMDVAFNMLDSPRVIIPQSDLTVLNSAEKKSGTKNEFTKPPTGEDDLAEQPLIATYRSSFDSFAHQSSWGHAKLSCPPDAPVKLGKPSDGFSQYGLSIGFLKNHSAATDICLEPAYQHQHGIFVRPETFNIIAEPIPIFSQSKLSTFGDILYPSPSYFVERAMYDETADTPWSEKKDVMYWRGSSTGLRSRDGSWRLGHRQRTLAYFNSATENCTLLMDLGDAEKINKETPPLTTRTSPTRAKKITKRWSSFLRRREQVDPDTVADAVDPVSSSNPAQDLEQVENAVSQLTEDEPEPEAEAELTSGGAPAQASSAAAAASDEFSSEEEEAMLEVARPHAEIEEADKHHFLEVGKKQDEEREQQQRDSMFVEQSVSKQVFIDHISAQFSSFTQCNEADCREQEAFFGKPAPYAGFQETWQYKYLLDMDGNSFSTRFYAFLRSRSAVVKQTLFREWHEDRLIPWVHYVPLSLDLKEGFEILRFLLDNDVSGKFIADSGRRWSKRTMRKEDMQIYFFRLMLEYGRLIDDNRDTIGCL
ncbi:hypothetical protein BZA70DRAFT_58323 [Myxozyma melibiosi]|uniref:Glycosyl transferase CAP10 domain-containing protein n=1 Tax=Myxozyma melibiosi TaxID=54550 RepID=A0ABR1F1K5_9ASCO